MQMPKFNTLSHSQTHLNPAVIVGNNPRGPIGQEFSHEQQSGKKACPDIMMPRGERGVSVWFHIGKEKTNNINSINAGKSSQSCLTCHDIKRFLAGKVSQQ